MATRKRGNSYQVTVYIGKRSDGTKITETATFKPEPGMKQKEIERALKKFEVEFEEKVKKGVNIKGERMTFEQLANLYLEQMKPDLETGITPLAQTTYSNYKRILNLHIIPYFGNFRINTIYPHNVAQYEKHLLKDNVRKDGKKNGFAFSTIRKHRQIISALLTYAVNEGFLTTNPLLNAKGYVSSMTRYKEENTVKCFTPEQTMLFLKTLDIPIQIVRKEHYRTNKHGTRYKVPAYSQEWKLTTMWKAFFYMALFTADRRGENISITWNDINFDTGEVIINKNTIYVDKMIIHKDTKTGNEKIISLPPQMLELLVDLKREQLQHAYNLGTCWKGFHGNDFDKNYVFTQDNGEQVHPSSSYHKFKTIIELHNKYVAKTEQENLPDLATQHHLRHTAASILLAEGLDIAAIASLLGHANPATTLKVYSHLYKNNNKKASDVLSNVLLNTSNAK